MVRRRFVYTYIFVFPCHQFLLYCKGAHTRTSLACESDSARVPISQARPCVVKLIRAGLASEIRTCLGRLMLISKSIMYLIYIDYS
jgi:hypothetical protein